MVNVDECLERFNAKTNALRDLIELMNKHNLTFEANVVYGDNGEECELKIMQDYFKDGDPIVLFSKKNGKNNFIDCNEILGY